SVPCAVALLTFSRPLVSVLYHYGAFSVTDVRQTSLALAGYGAGLLGLVAIKVLAPGFYARQDIRTPVKSAIVVLALTEWMNLLFVPRLANAGTPPPMGLGARIKAGWLRTGLIRRGAYRPARGWARFVLQVVAASGLLAVFLSWASLSRDWT